MNEPTIRVYARHFGIYYRLELTPSEFKRHNNYCMISAGLEIPDELSERALNRLIRLGRAHEVSKNEWNHGGCLSSCTLRGDDKCRW